MQKWTLIAASALIAAAAEVGALAPRDGRNLDPGASMTAPSERAPAELGALSFLLGDWQVEQRTFGDDDEPVVARGRSRMTLMNRGHAFMESLYFPASDDQGTGRSTLAFLTYVPSSGQWALGEADSLTEAIRLANGTGDGDRLVLRDAIRPRGGVQLVATERRIERTRDGFRVELAESTNGGTSWTTRWVRSYTPRPETGGAAGPASELGSPAPGLPAAAREFDFLIGRWDSQHDLKLPNGQNPKWRSNSSARYVLDGHAILEFDWFDADPNLPDSATSIVRIYNRAMRRWECLYMTNRTNALLHFGGRREGDEMVLHLFGHHTADPRIARFVFHDMGSDRYRWYSTVSRDRGRTFEKEWIIEVVRRPEPAADGGGG